MAVRCVQVNDELSEIQVAWPRIKAAVGPRRGRRFVAASDPTECWYRASVQIQPDATAAERALPEAAIPGGRILRLRLRGESPSVYDEIAPAYALLEASGSRDDSKPSLEHYRRLDEIDVLMPVT